MKYISTRGGMTPAPYSETLLEGLAPDGGLAVPEQLPKSFHIQGTIVQNGDNLQFGAVMGAGQLPGHDIRMVFQHRIIAQRVTKDLCRLFNDTGKRNGVDDPTLAMLERVLECEG